MGKILHGLVYSILGHECNLHTHKKLVVKSVADSERHWKFLVMVTKMYSDGHYLPQIPLPFHQVFLGWHM